VRCTCSTGASHGSSATLRTIAMSIRKRPRA
jgi:hypothetical protein